jgi:hypothetical protein
MTHSVAIVGLGPKGLYCLERLCAMQKEHPLQEPLHVHVFDRAERFGASPIYDTSQPEHILVNVSVGELDAWDVDDPPPVSGRGPDFVTWYAMQHGAELTGDEYLPRSVVGGYLIDVVRRIVDHVPDGMTLQCHAADVIDIARSDGAYRLHVRGGAEVAADKILLATGHSRPIRSASEEGYESFAKRHERAQFIRFVYPVVEMMKPVPATARVAMLGIGLTFIDALLELTEGRGGRFVRGGDGALAYERSGGEPAVVFPFSRTGLPMTPKARDLPKVPRPLTFVTPAVLENLRRTKSDGKLDFDGDVLPLVEREMEAEYRRVAGDAGAHFDCRMVVEPHIDGVADYLEREIERARVGQSHDPVKAAISLWSEIRTAIGTVLRFGGFTPESHRKLVEYYFPRFKRVTFGPPIVNAEKLLALVKAGVVDFSVSRNPRIVTNEQLGCFEIRGEHEVRDADVLIDARYPKTDVARDAAPLMRNLQRRGIIRPFRNRSYAPGAIDMNEGAQFVIGANGLPNEDIAVVGIPTEGNLVGNLSVTRDPYAAVWAAEVMRQMRSGEASRVA